MEGLLSGLDLSLMDGWMDDNFRVALKMLLIGLGVWLVLATIKRLLWGQIKRHAVKSSREWIKLVLESCELQAHFLLLLFSFGIASKFGPEFLAQSDTLVATLKVLFVIISFWILLRVFSVLVSVRLIFSNLSDTNETLVMMIVRVFLISMGGLIALDTAGVSITPLIASLGVGSIAIALALQDTLSNYFSGIYILIDKPVRLGDYIQLEGGVEGTVVKVGWRSTHIQMLASNVVVVPNSRLASATLTNFNMPDKEMGFLTPVGVSYNSDLEKVERVTFEVAKKIINEIPGAVKSFEPLIRYNAFSDSSINFNVIMRAQSFVDVFFLRHNFVKALHKRYEEEGINIPFPQRVVHMAPSKNPSQEIKN